VSIVDANAIGRGPIAPSKYWWSFGIGNDFGSILNMFLKTFCKGNLNLKGNREKK
jgi:hypothetical protein